MSVIGKRIDKPDMAKEEDKKYPQIVQRRVVS